MIIDCHCHAWESWPYQPEVPDPVSRARVERLLWEMDQCGVGKAVLISAGIKDNPDNSGYTAGSARRWPDRLAAFPDIDCRWSPTHHTPGAAARLIATVERLQSPGFTHYMDEKADPSWLLSDDGIAMFAAAEERGLIASLSCGPTQMPTVHTLAERFPRIPFLLHHLGWIPSKPRVDRDALAAVLALAAAPNVFIKFSGFGYAVDDGWNFPCNAARDVAKALYDRYGADRLCWGSDYPVSQRYMTYRQTLEIVHTHCDFIAAAEMEKILGGTMKKLLERSAAAG